MFNCAPQSGLPHELRPHDLETVGESKLGGRLETPVLAAHYRVMTEEDGSKTWVGFSANSGLGGTEMLFYEFAGRSFICRVLWKLLACSP
jgi:carotenoid cleavage dioxygenase-like enzyme